MEMKSIIGVDIGGTNVRAGKVHDYKISDIYSRRITADGSKEQVLNEIISVIKSIFDGSVAGIGVGVPSLVDVEKGIVYDVQNIPSWKEVELKHILEKEFQVPVYVNNDANCFVVGEKYFGAAKNYEHIVGLVIGTGLGSGIFFDNKLYEGANCGAGEFGMIPYKDGIYENYCSGQFFKKYYNSTGEELFLKAKNRDESALEAFKEFGIHLGSAVSTIIYSIDPEIIVLGGSISKAFDFYKESLYSVLNKFPYHNSIKKLKLEVSDLKHIAILGASALYYEYRGMNESQILADSIEEMNYEHNNI